MSQMFESFNHIPFGYIPDNMHKPPKMPGHKELVLDNLDAILDKEGKKKGYSWNYGETVSIPITVNIPVRVETDAYLTDEIGVKPDITTQGYVGQKFYNLRDVKSYVMRSYVPANQSYMWMEEPRFTFPEAGPKLVMITPDMTDKYILCEFMNFRGEQMFEQSYQEVNECNFVIDHDLSLALLRGIYELNIYVGDNYDEYTTDGTEMKKLTKRYEIVIR